MRRLRWISSPSSAASVGTTMTPTAATCKALCTTSPTRPQCGCLTRTTMTRSLYSNCLWASQPPISPQIPHVWSFINCKNPPQAPDMLSGAFPFPRLLPFLRRTDRILFLVSYGYSMHLLAKNCIPPASFFPSNWPHRTACSFHYLFNIILFISFADSFPVIIILFLHFHSLSNSIYTKTALGYTHHLPSLCIITEISAHFWHRMCPNRQFFVHLASNMPKLHHHLPKIKLSTI